MGITYGKFVSDRKIAHILHRKDQKMCDFGAWHWLLSQAAFKEHQMNYHGRIITIKSGDIPITYRDLAKTFNWSVGRLQTFINNLKRAEIINTSSDTGFLMISICNYEEIQSLKYGDSTENGTKADTKAGTNRTNDNERKEPGSALPAVAQAEPESKIPRWKILMKDSVGAAPYRSWIKPLSYDNGYILCSSGFVEDWCKNHYAKEIEKALNDSGKDFKGFKVSNVINLDAKVANQN